MPSVWLMKSEPDVFSLDDLKNCPKKTEPWDGIRNYQARNFMRDDMKKGDVVLFYHSNCKEPGIVGLAEIASSSAYPDPTQFDKKSNYFDPKSDPDNPRWLLVDVRYKKTLKRPVTLKEIKEHPVLSEMKVAQRGMRLSIQPVEQKHFEIIKSI
jgi:predicted RNA-binding protein with PUA-like domain